MMRLSNVFIAVGLAMAAGLQVVLSGRSEDCRGGSWTIWYDRDDPSGDGDFEELDNHQVTNPEICQYPIDIHVTQVDGSPIPSWQIVTNNVSVGFYCRNDQQPENITCLDYRVRFCCADEIECNSPNSWTDWINLSTPNSTGEWEPLSAHVASDPDKYCGAPTTIDARLTDGRPLQLGGDNLNYFSASQGLLCLTSEQYDQSCEDYEVRYCCKTCEEEEDA